MPLEQNEKKDQLISEGSDPGFAGLTRTWRGTLALRSADLITRGLIDLAKLDDIFVAAKVGNVRRARAILRVLPEQVNARGKLRGETPLHVAARCGHIAVCELLLAYGADPEATTSEKTPREDGWSERGATPLHWAVKRERVSVIRLLLADRAFVDSQDATGETPLHWAARFGRSDAAKLLLDSGAAPNVDAKGRGAPLHWAARWGHNRVVQLLLSRHADVAIRSKYGETPLHWAVRWNHKQSVKLLLTHGAQVNATCNTGRTPMNCARDEEMRRILREQAFSSPTTKPPKGKPSER